MPARRADLVNSEIAKLYASGFTYKAIGELLNAGSSTIRSRLMESGVSRRLKAIPEPRSCACGCGKSIIPKPYHRYYVPRYIHGHQGRGKSLTKKTTAPQPGDDVPSGICECGCGEPTPLATKTHRTSRRFKDYPLALVPGHRKIVRGKNNPNWAGGRFVRKSGYVYVNKPDHPYANTKGYIPEHRLVMEEKLGRYLLPEESVHHVNHRNEDNRPENLELFSDNGLHRHAEHSNCNPNKSSKFQGVSKEHRTNKWVARFSNKHVGTFPTEKDAARAYNEAASKRYGKYAKLNIID